MIIDVDPEAVRRARNARRRRHLSIDPVGNGMVEVYGLLDAAKGAVLDPEAVRRARNARRRRHLSIDPVGNGMVEVYGLLDAAKGAVLDQQLDAVARTVCPHDPRTHAQRRADAVDALQVGGMACLCGRADCPAAGNKVPTGQYVIHVIAGQDSTDAATSTDAPAAEGNATTFESRDPAAEVAAATPPSAPTPAPKSPPAALIPGYGPITADQLRDLLPYATIRPVTDGSELGTEHGYHPSRALTEFIGCRDLICRWPGCTIAAQRCDTDHTTPWPYGPTHPSNTKLYCRIHHLIKTWPGCTIAAQRCDTDHTTPWPYGPTHPSNTKLYCRIHHLIKTFHCGPGGWTESQHPDGTITLTAPTGRTYTTTPGGRLFFPQLGTATAELPTIDMPPPNPHRTLAAPRRSRTRAQNRAYRIAHERALNRELPTIDMPPPNPHRTLAAPRRSRTRAQNRAYRIAHERALNRAHIDADPPPF
ncbi:DUF222 domain-containing protein [Mycolicibacterium bacteremicum]|nr:DUF222 domain-containing protein [Mycolicibacterium bacteremicum]